MSKDIFTMSMSGDRAVIAILDEIDDTGTVGLSAKMFKTEFDKIKHAKSIKLELNSPGGSVFDGLAIHNYLATVREKLDVEIIGLGASIASIIALAGRSLTMARGAYFMIHNPSAITTGDSAALRKTAATMDKLRSDFVKIYKAKCRRTEAEIVKWMDLESWFTASEAVAAGFADAAVDMGAIAARAGTFDLGRFKHPPVITKAKALNYAGWTASDFAARIEADRAWLEAHEKRMGAKRHDEMLRLEASVNRGTAVKAAPKAKAPIPGKPYDPSGCGDTLRARH